jgi:L-arabinokinase
LNPSRRRPPVVVYYISGHGFGHATRAIEIVNALLARRPDVQVHIRTRAPRWLFDLTVRGPFTIASVETDPGVVQTDALTPDLDATLERAAAFHAAAPVRIAEEADALRRAGADLVLGDIPPLAFSAGARGGVPSVACGNFTWDWIYEDYARERGEGARLAGQMREWQREAREAWRLPMGGGFEGMTGIRDLPLVARRSRRAPAETRQALGLDDGRLVLLVSFGGVGLASLPLDRVARSGDLLVVTTEDPGQPRTAGRPPVRVTADGVAVVDERGLYEAGWRYEDLVAAADVVVSKPGFGSVAECIAHGTAMLYTSRGRFAEYDVLVAAMRRWLRCRFIGRDDLWSGNWGGAIRGVLAEPDVPDRPAVDGAATAAGWIVSALCR